MLVNFRKNFIDCLNETETITNEAYKDDKFMTELHVRKVVKDTNTGFRIYVEEV